MLNNTPTFTAEVDPTCVSLPPQLTPHPGFAHSALAAAADVSNLFARFGARDGAGGYREIHSDADAAAAAARWPLLAEWLVSERPAPERWR